MTLTQLKLSLLKAGADIHAGDGGYGIGTRENYEEFVKMRNKSLNLEQEEQPSCDKQGEPVAWRAPNWGHSADDYVYRDFDDPVIGADGKPSPNNEPLYTTPQPVGFAVMQKLWVGLTDEEKENCLFSKSGLVMDYADVIDAVEAKLKEKNA